MKILSALFLGSWLAIFPLSAFANESGFDDPWTSTSPNGKYFIATRIIPDDELIWKSDADGFRLVVFPAHGDETDLEHLLFSKDFDWAPVSIKWSPDSQYIVILVISSGGHSPWHLPAFVYSVKQNKIVDVEKVANVTTVDSNVKGYFTFKAPHTCIFQITGKNGWDPDHPTAKTIDLSTLFTKSALKKNAETTRTR